MSVTRHVIVDKRRRKNHTVTMDIHWKFDLSNPAELEKMRKIAATMFAKLLAVKVLEDAGEHIAAERVWDS